MLMRHLSPSDESVGSKRHRITLVPGANAVDSRMPPAWRGAEGDGRAREGRDRVWVVADVVLAVKVSVAITGPVELLKGWIR